MLGYLNTNPASCNLVGTTQRLFNNSSVSVPMMAAPILSIHVYAGSPKAWWVTLRRVCINVLLVTGLGLLTITLSDVEKVKRLRYRVFQPWVPVLVFFLLTILLSIEGWACWLMMLPVFLALASLGGLTAGYFKLKKHSSSNKLNVSFALLLPFAILPVEDMVKAPASQYEAYTYIDINAPQQSIWNNVLRVKEINAQEDKGVLTNLLGFPRPLHAELNYAGVGASRKAVFTKGLVFNEVVTDYADKQRMHFSIQANTYSIPSTTMDKHILIGGDYFNVNDGTYMLQKLNSDTYRLHLYSHFTITTTFNFYAAMWAGWIMKDIQNNILQVIKHRCEAAS